ncbi:unnamed protein product [Sphagnum troendelagicum]|uniref:ABC transporter domain-containing protein n=1 Tax=Sphagnum troendelagicum TaxID=128251 RepID=A0ABP0UTB3_9BRYO
MKGHGDQGGGLAWRRTDARTSEEEAENKKIVAGCNRGPRVLLCGLSFRKSRERKEGEDGEVREHLLSIPVEVYLRRSLQRRSGAKVSIVNLERFSDTGVPLLSGVSLNVQSGQVVGIIGPSGSGKSTLLRCLNRLWEPPADSVFLDGEDVTKMNVLTTRRRIGMLFQTPILFEGTVGDNVRYGPTLQGKTLSEAAVTGLLRLADLDASFANKSIIGLSVGQAQRVALARTLANEPEVLLLDEPTSALDPISTHHIEDTVLQLKKTRGLTVIMVSHSIEQVKRLVDVVCVVVAGKLVEVLKIEDLDNASNPQAQEFLHEAQRK